MEILTSQDRELVECCDCHLPECPGPETECQALHGVGVISWVLYRFSTDTYYQTDRTDWADGGFRQRKYSQPFSAYFLPLPEGGVSMAVDEWTEGDPQTGDRTDEQLDPIDIEAARASAYTALAGAVDWGNENCVDPNVCTVLGQLPEAKRIDVEVVGYDPAPTTVLTVTWARYRMGVPEFYSTEDNPRSVFEVQWDEVQAPDDWWDWFDGGKEGEEPAGGPTLVASRTWSWDGDMEARWSEWFEMAPPAVSENTIRVANILVKCWASARVGVAPTAHGDIVEL